MLEAAIGSSTSQAVDRATRRLVSLQAADGSWEGEVVWCPVITAQVVIMWAIAGRCETPERRARIVRHFERTRRPDGGWGLHPQSHSYRFVTTLVYVAARLLGESANSPMLISARAFLDREPGGIAGLPQWGKVWLSFIGLYDNGGLNPCPPELFLLPRWLPISLFRAYCHTRQIYLGMAFLLGSDFRADVGPITAELKKELGGSASGIDPAACRHELAATDAYVLPGPILRFLYDTLHHLDPVWRRVPGAAALRRRALDLCYEEISYEQQVSCYQGLSPVSSVLNTLALHARDPASPDTVKSIEGIEAWRWDDDNDGLRYAGARSTTWDTSFALQALLAQREPECVETLRRGYRRLVEMQIVSELDDGAAHGRDPVLGGWCFSDGVHRWPVSDCTAEGVIALLDCHAVPGLIPEQSRISKERLAQAAVFLLSRQNADGGFGTYERRRGGDFLESFNPSQMFGQCMTEHSYLECTASCVRALVRLTPAGLSIDRHRLEEAARRGVAAILARQQPDGSWQGFWGINFIYGTHFAVSALREAGLPANHPAICRAHEWLQRVQRSDGGWGEHFSGCLSGTYVEDSQSLVISTAWAVLAMLDTELEPSPATDCGAEWLIERRQPDGDWPRDSVNGVFFGTAMLDYRLYNSYFPAMALARFEAHRHATH